MKITFFRLAKTESGQSYKSPLMSFIYPDTMPELEALRDARKDFEEKMNISDWQSLADSYEFS